jgi:uronate dehydrogenase
MAPCPSPLLLTGAAGTLGRALTPALKSFATTLRVSDLPAALARVTVPEGVQTAPCDLADPVAVHELLDGIQAIVHLGGVSVEGPFGPILSANILGLHNLYEAARRRGVKRIVFASSNHVTGCYRREDKLTTADRPRPDGNYGLSKFFGEGLASLYWDRYGIETVCLRIGTATPTPPDRRGLSGWLSPRDLIQLVQCALTAPDVGFLIAFGCSDNARSWWDSAASWAKLGYQPMDRSEDYAPAVGHLELPPGPQSDLQGGSFLGMGPYDNDRP